MSIYFIDANIAKANTISTDIFTTDTTPKKLVTSEKDSLIFQLRSSAELDSNTVAAIITLVELAYDKKTSEK